MLKKQTNSALLAISTNIQGVFFHWYPPKSSKYKQVNQARLGVSWPIYVNVDSPNLGFPYLKNGKKPKHDQHCGQTNFFCSDQYPLEILACEAFLLKSAAFFSNQKVCEPLLY